MEKFVINYFNEREVGYFGTVEGAIEYAEGFARNLILTYDGEISIRDGNGDEVASQKWNVAEDGSSTPEDWRWTCAY